MKLTVSIDEQKITDSLVHEASKYAMNAFNETTSWRLSADDRAMLSKMSEIIRQIYKETMETQEFRDHMSEVVRGAIVGAAKEKAANWAKKQTVEKLGQFESMGLELKQ